MGIFQSAVDNWPEDEARQIANSWNCQESKEEYSPEEWRDNIFRDCVRMEKFFAQESDGPELVKRFRAEILKQLELPTDFFTT